MLVHKLDLNLIKNFGQKLVKNFLTKIGQNLFQIFVRIWVQNIGLFWSKNFFQKMVQNVCPKIGLVPVFAYFEVKAMPRAIHILFSHHIVG